jgi:hypothetical protein
MSEWSYRLAEPSDGAAFAEWVQANPQISPEDVQRTLNGKNPTCIFLVACYDGKPMVFAPMYAQMHLAHLVFSPEARATEKLKALKGLLDFATAIAVQCDIHEITTLTRESYAMGKFALHLGFEKDARELFRFDINKVLPPRK